MLHSYNALRNIITWSEVQVLPGFKSDLRQDLQTALKLPDHVPFGVVIEPGRTTLIHANSPHMTRCYVDSVNATDPATLFFHWNGGKMSACSKETLLQSIYPVVQY